MTWIKKESNVVVLNLKSNILYIQVPFWIYAMYGMTFVDIEGKMTRLVRIIVGLIE